MRKMIALAVLPVALAACAGQARKEDTAAAATPFTQALAEEYRLLAATERNQADWADGAKFRSKFEAAKAGRVPAPEDPAGRGIGSGFQMHPDLDVAPQARDEAIEGRQRLMAALSGGATERNPTVAARTQVAYDCWVEQLEEGWQAADIARCRQAFTSGLAQLEARPVAAAAPAAPPPEVAATAIFFALDSAEVSPAGRQRLQAIAEDIRRENPDSIMVVGHADRSGADSYNERLSMERAQAVKEALVAEGIPEGKLMVRARGENDPLIATADGRPLAENRRVFIGYD